MRSDAPEENFWMQETKVRYHLILIQQTKESNRQTKTKSTAQLEVGRKSKTACYSARHSMKMGKSRGPQVAAHGKIKVWLPAEIDAQRNGTCISIPFLLYCSSYLFSFLPWLPPPHRYHQKYVCSSKYIQIVELSKSHKRICSKRNIFIKPCHGGTPRQHLWASPDMEGWQDHRFAALNLDRIPNARAKDLCLRGQSLLPSALRHYQQSCTCTARTDRQGKMPPRTLMRSRVQWLLRPDNDTQPLPNPASDDPREYIPAINRQHSNTPTLQDSNMALQQGSLCTSDLWLRRNLLVHCTVFDIWQWAFKMLFFAKSCGFGIAGWH